MRYAIYNVVRGRTNRTLRAAAPAHLGLVQYIGGRRVLRGRPIILSEDELRRVLPDLEEKAQRGAIEVRTVDGRRLDLRTLDAPPAAAPPPAPHLPLDSLAKDDARGEKVTPADVPVLLAETPEEDEPPRVVPDIPPALPPPPPAIAPIATDAEPKLPALLADAGREEPEEAPTPKRGKKR